MHAYKAYQHFNKEMSAAYGRTQSLPSFPAPVRSYMLPERPDRQASVDFSLILPKLEGDDHVDGGQRYANAMDRIEKFFENNEFCFPTRSTQQPLQHRSISEMTAICKAPSRLHGDSLAVYIEAQENKCEVDGMDAVFPKSPVRQPSESTISEQYMEFDETGIYRGEGSALRCWMSYF